jgi:two-component system invasion response regulator UvrY
MALQSGSCRVPALLFNNKFLSSLKLYDPHISTHSKKMNLNHTQFLIIEDHEVVVFALKEILIKHFPDSCFQAVDSLDQGIQVLKQGLIDLVILDIGVEGGNNPKMVPVLRASQPQVKILIHSGVEEDKESLRYLMEGADGFFSKKDTFQMLPHAVKTVLGGKRYVNNAMQTLIINSYIHQPDEPKPAEQPVVLSPREIEVISLLLAGKWTKEIANILDIKLPTVSTHKARIFEKLEINSVIELYKKIEKGWPALLDRV